MYISRVMNLSLLNKIREFGEVDKYELKRAYAKPDPPGIVSAANACFDNDLRDLELEGKIQINDNIIKFLKL